MDDFQRASEWVNNWVADYLQHSEKYPVLSQVEPGEVARQLPAEPPQEPEPFERILRDFEKVILPGITHWNHPGFFAYFAITGSPPGVLADTLSAALNVNAMLWKTSPAATELEEVTLDWLRQMLGFPQPIFGVMMDTASIGTVCAMAAAREALQLNVRELGLAGRSEVPPLAVYTSEHANSSIDKSAIVLGFGQKNLRKVPVDSEYRMRADVFADQVREDRSRGILPCCVVATVGTTSTSSIDPVPAIADICASEKIWLHVDAAYAGPAAIIPEMRHVLHGCERADSFVTNPHKWLFVPFDCTAFYTKHPKLMRSVFSLAPEYLQVDRGFQNLTDYGIQLGRKFRALKLWMVIRSYGVRGLQDALRSHLALARDFAGWVQSSSEFELMAPVPFSLVCFRAKQGSMNDSDLNALNMKLMEAVNRTGEMYISHTALQGKTTLRLAIGNLQTQKRHVERAWDLLNRELKALLLKHKDTKSQS